MTNTNTPVDIRKLALEMRQLLTKFTNTEEEHQERLRAISICATHLSETILSPATPSEGVAEKCAYCTRVNARFCYAHHRKLPTIPSEAVEEEREAFERACDLEGIASRRHDAFPDQYRLWDTQCKWMGWQAARAALPPVEEGGIDDENIRKVILNALMDKYWHGGEGLFNMYSYSILHHLKKAGYLRTAPAQALPEEVAKYYRVMDLLKRAKGEHGLCQPRGRKACSACNAQENIDALLESYGGAPIVLSAALSQSTTKEEK